MKNTFINTAVYKLYYRSLSRESNKAWKTAYEKTTKCLAISKQKTHYRHHVQIVTISIAQTKNLACFSIQLYAQRQQITQYKMVEGGGSQFLKYKFLKKKKKVRKLRVHSLDSVFRWHIHACVQHITIWCRLKTINKYPYRLSVKTIGTFSVILTYSMLPTSINP